MGLIKDFIISYDTFGDPEEEQEVVAEVLQVETEDVAIIAEAVKSDTVVANAVEEYVERAVENADVDIGNAPAIILSPLSLFH